MSTQLTTTNHNHSTGLAMPTGTLGVEGLEGLTQRDVILPRWSLIQPTSKKDGADTHVGQFQRNLDGAFRESLEVVILSVTPSRLLWSGSLDDRRPECFSRDGVQGSVYGACDQCSFNISANPELAKQIKEGLPVKVCSYGYNLLAIDDLTEETPSLIGAMGTSVRPTKTLISQFAMRRRPPFSALVRLESERVTNDKGKFYVLKPVIKNWLDGETAAHYRAIWQQYQGVTVRDIDEEPIDTVDEPTF